MAYLIGRDGELFLAHGGHHILGIVTGKRLVSRGSTENFKYNSQKRKTFTESNGATYLHIIFPDKQTVLRNEVTIEDPICLGEYYLTRAVDVAQCIFHPVHLRPEFQ
jgi:hypothetical protein